MLHFLLNYKVSSSSLFIKAPMVIEGRRPPNEWPGEGKINIRDYSTRYREGLDLVLRRINCDIPGGQKVSRTYMHPISIVKPNF